MARHTHHTKLPILNDIRIASPCSESWDGMVGDDKVRFCGGCMKNVYNLSAMTEGEAEDLIEDKEGHLCVRLYRRKDGTVITSDCPVGQRRKRVTRIAAAALAFGGAGFALAMLPAAEAHRGLEGDTLGEPRERTVRTISPKRTISKRNAQRSWAYDLLSGEEDVEEVVMGDMVEVPPPARMGKIAMPPQRHGADDKVPRL